MTCFISAKLINAFFSSFLLLAGLAMSQHISVGIIMIIAISISAVLHPRSKTIYANGIVAAIAPK